LISTILKFGEIFLKNKKNIDRKYYKSCILKKVLSYNKYLYSKTMFDLVIDSFILVKDSLFCMMYLFQILEELENIFIYL